MLAKVFRARPARFARCFSARAVDSGTSTSTGAQLTVEDQGSFWDEVSREAESQVLTPRRPNRSRRNVNNNSNIFQQPPQLDSTERVQEKQPAATSNSHHLENRSDIRQDQANRYGKFNNREEQNYALGVDKLQPMDDHKACKDFARVSSTTQISKLTGALLHRARESPERKDGSTPLVVLMAGNAQSIATCVRAIMAADNMSKHQNMGFNFEFEVVSGQDDPRKTEDLPDGVEAAGSFEPKHDLAEKNGQELFSANNSNPMMLWLPVYLSPVRSYWDPNLQSLLVGRNSNGRNLAAAMFLQYMHNGRFIAKAAGTGQVHKCVDSLVRFAEGVRRRAGSRIRCCADYTDGGPLNPRKDISDADNNINNNSNHRAGNPQQLATGVQIMVRQHGENVGPAALRVLPSIDQLQCKVHLRVSKTSLTRNLVGALIGETRNAWRNETRDTMGSYLVVHAIGEQPVLRALHAIAVANRTLGAQGLRICVEASGSGHLNERHHKSIWLSNYLDDEFNPMPNPEDRPFRCSARTTLQKMGPALYHALLEKPSLSILAVGPGPVFSAVDILTVVSKNMLKNESKRVRFTIQLEKIDDEIIVADQNNTEDEIQTMNHAQNEHHAQFQYRINAQIIAEHHATIPERVDSGDNKITDRFESSPRRDTWKPNDDITQSDNINDTFDGDHDF